MITKVFLCVLTSQRSQAVWSLVRWVLRRLLHDREYEDATWMMFKWCVLSQTQNKVRSIRVRRSSQQNQSTEMNPLNAGDQERIQPDSVLAQTWERDCYYYYYYYNTLLFDQNLMCLHWSAEFSVMMLFSVNITGFALRDLYFVFVYCLFSFFVNSCKYMQAVF